MLRKRVSGTLLAVAMSVCFAAPSALADEKTARDEHKLDLKRLGDAVDLRPMLKGKTLTEGLTLIYTTPKGVKISAKLGKDKSIDWVVTDKDGKEIPTTLYELSERGAGAAAAKTIRCWKCYSSPDGGLDCFEIECPFKK